MGINYYDAGFLVLLLLFFNEGRDLFASGGINCEKFLNGGRDLFCLQGINYETFLFLCVWCFFK